MYAWDKPCKACCTQTCALAANIYHHYYHCTSKRTEGRVAARGAGHTREGRGATPLFGACWGTPGKAEEPHLFLVSAKAHQGRQRGHTSFWCLLGSSLRMPVRVLSTNTHSPSLLYCKAKNNQLHAFGSHTPCCSSLPAGQKIMSSMQLAAMHPEMLLHLNCPGWWTGS